MPTAQQAMAAAREIRNCRALLEAKNTESATHTMPDTPRTPKPGTTASTSSRPTPTASSTIAHHWEYPARKLPPKYSAKQQTLSTPKRPKGGIMS